MSEIKKKLVESGSLTLIRIYLNYFLGIINIFFVARLITPEEWALLLLTISFGDISTYFFYPAHHITMGEGGALLTNNLKLHKIINSLREWGRDC